jgi:Ser/Thr protein kinase RdoA (MazF antagonist)
VREGLPIDGLRRGLRAWGLEQADVIAIVPGVTADVFLIMQSGERWVAKYNYDYRDHFEIGLHVSQLVADRVTGDRFEVAVPVPTNAGELTEMVEWPDGHHHPLALLTYVRGDPLRGEEPAATSIVGDVCGRVHAALLEVRPDDVGIRQLLGEPDFDHPDRDAGDHGWLHRAARALDQETRERRGEVRAAVSVWDGPDIRRARDSIGLLDFGHCGLQPIPHVVANRSLLVSLNDESQLEPFLEAVERHLPLTPAEHELLPRYRLLNAAIYARWVAMERVTRGEPSFNDPWFRQLVSMLRRYGADPPAD